LASYSARLEHEVRLRTRELEAARLEAIHCLARAAEFRDDDTGKHVIRVGGYAAIIARHLGFNKQRVEILELAAQLHDVGKIGVPDAILLKPGKLDEHEFALMREHCAYGETITQPFRETCPEILRRHTEMGAGIIGMPSSPIMQLAAKIALTHHERWDGSGYPAGLSGEEIPIEGRITAVADVYDALSSVRPYKKAFPEEKCLAIISENRGSHFDPQVVDAFFARIEDIRNFKRCYSDPT
jgi:putative two-component system response regulator